MPRRLVDGGHVLTELPRRRRFELALRDLVEEGFVADLQDAGGFRAVPLDALEHIREGLPLGRVRPIPGDLSRWRMDGPAAACERSWATGGGEWSGRTGGRWCGGEGGREGGGVAWRGGPFDGVRSRRGIRRPSAGTRPLQASTPVLR